MAEPMALNVILISYFIWMNFKVKKTNFFVSKLVQGPHSICWYGLYRYLTFESRYPIAKVCRRRFRNDIVNQKICEIDAIWNRNRIFRWTRNVWMVHAVFLNICYNIQTTNWIWPILVVVPLNNTILESCNQGVRVKVVWS